MSNSLASVHPELIPEWSERNLPLTPDKITFGSNKRVWWKGACGHEWETSVKARSKGEKCPICSGARVIEGINDLATLKPLLAQEWSEKNELKPTEVSVASHKKIIWKCKHGHEWEASVKSRTINGTGCPYCSHNKVLAGFNDLASQYPDIAAEWSDRNLPLQPTVYSKTVLPIRRLKICKIKSITEKPQEPTSHELPKGSAMTLPEFMVFLFQSKDKQTNKRGDENGLQSIDRSRA